MAEMVSRVKIPTLTVFGLISDLDHEMTSYEHRHGEIPPFEEPR